MAMRWLCLGFMLCLEITSNGADGGEWVRSLLGCFCHFQSTLPLRNICAQACGFKPLRLHKPHPEASLCTQGKGSLKAEPCIKVSNQKTAFSASLKLLLERTERASLLGAQTVRVFNLSTFHHEWTRLHKSGAKHAFYPPKCPSTFPWMATADSHSKQTCCFSGNQPNAVTSSSKPASSNHLFPLLLRVCLQVFIYFWRRQTQRWCACFPMARLVSTCQAGGCLEITVYVTARFRLRVKSMVCVYPLTSRELLNAPESLPVIMRYQMHHCSCGDTVPVDLLSAQLCFVFFGESKSQSIWNSNDVDHYTRLFISLVFSGNQPKLELRQWD